jgi:uncharacterized membrane protein (UPF0127 family)
MKTGYLEINNSIFNTLLAISSDEQEQGLMFESWPPPIMSFIYASPRPVSFWMKNTPSPLDIVFCYDGKIKKIAKGEPFSTASISSNCEVDLVVEFPYGTMSSLGVSQGHKLELFNPSKKELNKILSKNIYFI